MNIEEREDELKKQYKEGLMSFSDFALAWIQAQEDIGSSNNGWDDDNECPIVEVYIQ